VRVGIIIPTLTDGDAVGHDSLGMAAHLRARGADVSFFVTRCTVEEEFHDIDDIALHMTSPDDVLIYHHSIGFERGVRAIERLPAQRKAVKYHNVTPPQFFKGINSEVMKACSEGIAEVGRLAATDAHLWADSVYNGEHIRSFAPGRAYDDIPPYHHADELLAIAPDSRAVSGLDDWNTNVLFVGRVVPNKNVPLALDAFEEFRRRRDGRARLIIVGDMPVPKHAAEVRKRILGAGLGEHVLVTGKVTTAQLKALYLTADLLLVTSLHEGFCVPLIEAMGLRLPVVAVPTTAIPYTGGEAVAYAQSSAESIAAAMESVLVDPAGAEAQRQRGWDRYRSHFRNEVIDRRFGELVDRLLAS